nr:hypothetical protein CFP56_73227 [Quercus suber]
MGKEDNPMEENSGVHTTEPAAARASTLNKSHYAHYGKGRLDGTVSKIRAPITTGIYSEDTLVESHVPSLAPCRESRDSVLNLNEDLTNGPKIDKNELGQAKTQSDRTKRSWKRINRTDFRPSEEISTTNKLKLGKRQMGDVLEENCEAGTTMLHKKRARVKFGDCMSDSISVGVEDHPCRKP